MEAIRVRVRMRVAKGTVWRKGRNEIAGMARASEQVPSDEAQEVRACEIFPVEPCTRSSRVSPC